MSEVPSPFFRNRSFAELAIHAFSFIGVLALMVILFFSILGALIPPPELTPFLYLAYELMFYYLIFIALRAGSVLLFSFADRFFSKKNNTPQHFPMVSILVPCFNEEKVVQHAVQSLLKIDYPNFEIIVIDDGSSDLTLLLAKAFESEIRVRVIYQVNQGKANALNRGISEAHGEYIFSMDADSILDRDALKLGVPYLNASPKTAAVAGKVIVGNANNALTQFQKLEYIVGLNFQKSAQSFLSMVTIIPGPVGLFRRSAVLAVGGYSSITFAEDCDLTIRLLMKGYGTVYCPDMIATTEAPDDYFSLLKQRYRWSRGTLQAIKVNAKWLVLPWINLRNFFILWYFLLETMMIPSVNFIFAFFTVGHALHTGNILAMGPFFLQLALLEMLLSTYCLITEPKIFVLSIYSLINRATYGLSMEAVRFLSLIDELLGLPMNWNKLNRKGL